MGDLLSLIKEFHFLAAFWMTIKLTVLGAIGSLILGTIIAIFRVSPVPVLRGIGTAYVTLIRNTPLTLIAFVCSVALLGTLGISLASPNATDDVVQNGFRWGVIAISVYHATFVAEALRSGVNTVPQGQAEAARAIGLGFGQSLSTIILPQAFRGAIAPLGNTLIALTKNTTVLSTVGVAEMSYAMKSMIEARASLLYLIFLLVAAAFVILTLPVGAFFTSLSKRLAVRR
ncbi:MAG TPA: amino acid ABC transporter permease [Microlunatus sp.]